MSLGLVLTIGSLILFNKSTKSQTETIMSYDEQTVAEISRKEKNIDHILDSNGRLYRSASQHSVVETLVGSVSCNNTYTSCLWMQKAPSFADGKLLLQTFYDTQPPVLNLGHVYKYSEDDRNCLKELVRGGFQLGVWDSFSSYLKPSGYKKSLQEYISLIEQETRQSTGDSHHNTYSIEKAAVICCGEDGSNHILTGNGTIIRSSIEQSVVGVLVSNAEYMNATTLWIKQAPNAKESELLKQFYDQKSPKPILYVGHVHKYTKEDRQGLKDLLKEGFKLEVWENVSNRIKPHYTKCLHGYMRLLGDEMLTHPDDEPTNYTEEKVAIISCGEDRVTHLVTNQGKMYRNSYKLKRHAEVTLSYSTDVHDTNDITKIWIKNSPCYECSQVLREYFKNSKVKPILYVGSIYRTDNPEDRNELLALLRVGFRLEVWDSMNILLFGNGSDSNRSEKYLSGLREEIQKFGNKKSHKHCNIL